MPSLLPYLQPKQGHFRLRLSRSCPASEERMVEPCGSLPFTVLWDADPFTRIFRARLVTDAGCEVVPLYLFVQKDLYGNPTLTAIRTNTDLDTAWLNALRYYQKELREELMLVQGQTHAQGWLESFDPLLYCRKTDRFFHLFCPRCGHIMKLCRDDNILEQCGLELYTQTLRRYLFCPVCHQSRFGSPFYVYAPPSPLSALDESTENRAKLQTDLDDSIILSIVKNQHDLIAEYARLPVAEMKPESDFPCPSCSFREECYGQKQQIQERIAVFSFYPFYAFIFRNLPKSRSCPPLVTIPKGFPGSIVSEPQKKTPGAAGALHQQKVGVDPNHAIHNILQRIWTRWASRNRWADASLNEEVTETRTLLLEKDQIVEESPESVCDARSSAPDISDKNETIVLVDRVDETLAGDELRMSDSQILTETLILAPGKPEDSIPEEARRSCVIRDELDHLSLTETVVVSDASSKLSDTEPGEKCKDASGQLTETVQLSSDGYEAGHATHRKDEDGPGDDLAKTVMVHAPRESAANEDQRGAEMTFDNLKKTVILPPSGVENTTDVDQPTNEGSTLTDTLILNSGSTRKGLKKQAISHNAQDLEDTVLLSDGQTSDNNDIEKSRDQKPAEQIPETVITTDKPGTD